MKSSSSYNWLRAGLLVLIGLRCHAGIAADPPLVFPIREGDLHGLIDRDGKVILPAEFTHSLSLSDGLIMATKGAKTAFFDATGKMVIKPQDQTRGPFSEGLAPAYVADGVAGKPGLGYVDRDLKPCCAATSATPARSRMAWPRSRCRTNGAWSSAATSTDPASSSSPRSTTRRFRSLAASAA
jgi:hypothetical protein